MSQQPPDSESSSAKHTVGTSPEDTLKYWTAEKKRKAKPAHLPHVNASEHEKQQSQHFPQAPDAQKP